MVLLKDNVSISLGSKIRMRGILQRGEIKISHCLCWSKTKKVVNTLVDTPTWKERSRFEGGQ